MFRAINLAFFLMLSITLSLQVKGQNQNRGEEESHGFIPDSTINNCIKLWNEVSVVRNCGDLMGSLDTDADFPDVFFCGAEGTQYLRFIFHPGSCNNQFAEFEVGYSSKKYPMMKCLEKGIVTESGIGLGINTSELKKIKGVPDSIDKEGSMQIYHYLIEDTDSDPFLKKYNAYMYHADYYFNKGVLVRFRFGFAYL